MTGPSSHGPAETLEHGPAPRPRSPARRGWRVLALVLVAVLAAVAAVIDHRARDREDAQLAACRRAATGAVGFANRRVDAIAGYVRPALYGEPGAALRRQLLQVVSASVEPTVPQVSRARQRCAAATVLWTHGDLRRTRRDCLRLLDRDLAYLHAVTADGQHAFDPRSMPGGRCSVPS